MSAKAEQLYEQARTLAPDARAAFIERACKDDPNLHAELASLLEKAEAAEAYFDLLGAVVLRTMTSASDPNVGATIGHYQVLACIGSGGMGTVYRAHDTKLDRDVALKFLPPYLSGQLEAQRRLLAEARAAAGLEHPNVCTIHEISATEDGRPFIAMGLCKGYTLKERLRAGPLPIDEVIDIGLQITSGLAAAHARGIVHRDVKPANVMLEDDGTVRILDFGLAEITDGTIKRPEATPGTLAYMSPEQARGEAVDRRSDLWSLGAVLYEMLSGVRPFRGDSHRALLDAILNQQPVSLSEIRPDTPRSLIRAVGCLLDKDVNARYASAAQLSADLSAVPARRAAPFSRRRHGPSVIGINLFGGFSVEGDSRVPTGRAAQRHRMALLALLAVEQPRGVAREKIIAWLWPESTTHQGRNMLNQAVHALRQSLGSNAIVSAGDELRLSPEQVTSDVGRFEDALAADDPELAAELYRGALLDGFFLDGSNEFERWIDSERQRLRTAYLRTLEQLAAAAGDDPLRAVLWWQRLAVEDPCNARVTLRLMEALSVAGDPAGAIRQAQLHTNVFREELDAEPDAAVIALAERLRSERPAGAETTATRHSASRDEPVRDLHHDDADDRDRAVMAADASAQVSRVVAATRASGHPRVWRGVAAGLAAAVVLFGGSWIVRGALERAAIGPLRIAVLPLANLMGDPEQDYFVAGMHDALIAEVSRIKTLTVLSRQSVMRYRGSDLPLPMIARELGVHMIVEGSVFRSGDSVRITVQLLRARPEEHLWARSYEGALGEALSMHSRVARAIASSIHASMAPDVRLGNSAVVVDPQAQEAYLRGVYERHRHPQLALHGDDRIDVVRHSIVYFAEAVSSAPQWAAAHAKLAEAYHFLASGLPGSNPDQDSIYSLSKAAAIRAIELDATHAQAHASLGFVQFMHERDWAAAERSFRRALELDPNSHHWGYALFLMAVGRYAEAISHFRMAEEREPLSDLIKWQRAQAYSCAGRHDEAIAQASALELRLDPAVLDARQVVRTFIAFEHSFSARFAESIAVMDSIVTQTDSSRASLIALAYTYARAGRLVQAHALTDRFEAEAVAAGSDFRAAHLYAALGDTARAIDLLESAIEARAIPAAALRCTRVYRELAGHERVQEIARRFAYPD